MKIIKPGKLPVVKPTILIGACIKCECEVQCEKTDTEILPYARRKPTFIVECPTPGCGMKIFLREVTKPEFPPNQFIKATEYP